MTNQNNLCKTLGAVVLLAAGCDRSPGGGGAAGDLALAQEVADALVAACPVAAPDDEPARAAGAPPLSDNKGRAGAMHEPFLWGGQKPGTSFHPQESNMNRFNAFVWRRMYLSLMM